jgi:O-antigen ligase
MPGEEKKAMSVSNRIGQLAHRGVLTLLLATVLIVPLIAAPGVGAWRGAKPIAFETMSLALVGLVLLQAAPFSTRRVLEFLRIGPNLPVLLLVLYGAVSWSRSPAPAFSELEWLRLACGAGLYFVVATVLKERAQVKTVVDVLIAVALLTSLFGIASYGAQDPSGVTVSFENKQLFAGFLLMLVPLLLALSFADLEPRRRITARAAAVLAVAALLLAQNRSSWLAALVAIAALGAMALRAGTPGRFLRGRHRLVQPLAILLGGLGLFLAISHTAPAVTARAATLTSAATDGSLAWRRVMWKGAWTLIRAQPIFGWGIGTFPLEQTRTVPGSLPRELLQRLGSTLGEQAHNEYLQITAEMGIIGLGLYLWVLVAFFRYSLRTLREREHGFRRLVLMGCLAALAGQVVDALADPAWRYAEVSFMFWLMMGLGMASGTEEVNRCGGEQVNRCSGEKDGTAPDGPLTCSPVHLFTSSIARLGWQGASLAFTLFAMSLAWTCHADPPDGQYPHVALKLVTEPPLPTGVTLATVAPGECLEFRLLAQITLSGSFEDVTDSLGATFDLLPIDSQTCLINNAPVQQNRPPQKNVFCVPRLVCSTPACGPDHRTIKVTAQYGGKKETEASMTVQIVCP